FVFTDLKTDRAFEDVERFLLSTVDVRWWPAARWYDGFPHRITTIRFFAGGHEAINISDDGDCSAFVCFAVNWGACHREISPAVHFCRLGDPCRRYCNSTKPLVNEVAPECSKRLGVACGRNKGIPCPSTIGWTNSRISS